jgi:hypothetical protein
MKILISTYKVLIAFFTFALSLSIASAQSTVLIEDAINGRDLFNASTITFEDVDNDGELDPANEDLDGDGNLDEGEDYVDVDGNGIYNAPIPAVLGDNPATEAIESDFVLEAFVPGDTFTDTNGNGVRDEVESDVNGDGVIGFVETWEDDNFDGIWNDEVLDENGNVVRAAEQFTDALNGVYDVGEAFTDENGNGVHDAGEPFVDALNGVYDLGEDFVDAGNGVYDVQEWTDSEFNDNGQYDPGEVFVDTVPADDYTGPAYTDGVYDGFIAAVVDEDGNVVTPARPAEVFVDSRAGVFEANMGEVHSDNDNDGVIDGAEVFVDFNEDGIWNNHIEDFDDDNQFDTVNEDTDLDRNLDIAEDVDGDNNMDVTYTLAYEVQNGVYDLGEEFTDALNNTYDEGEEYTDTNGNGEYDAGEPFVDALNGVYDQGEVFVDGTLITDLEITASDTVNIAAPNFTHNDVDVIDANELAAITDPMIADIATNAADIAINAGNIDINTADIATNAADIATNAAGIATNAAGIATNVSDIAVNRDGIAMAAAISHSTILPGMTQALDISHASFEGSSAMSINYSRKVKEGVQINLSHASAGDSHINKVGVGFQW